MVRLLDFNASLVERLIAVGLNCVFRTHYTFLLLLSASVFSLQSDNLSASHQYGFEKFNPPGGSILIGIKFSENPRG